MRLLLVEDDRMIGESLRSALRGSGYAVDWVRDGRAADAALSSERFDLVLLLHPGLFSSALVPYRHPPEAGQGGIALHLLPCYSSGWHGGRLVGRQLELDREVRLLLFFREVPACVMIDHE